MTIRATDRERATELALTCGHIVYYRVYQYHEPLYCFRCDVWNPIRKVHGRVCLEHERG